MKLEHAAVYVSDLELMKNFYLKYFGAAANDMYHNKTTGLKTYFLTFEDGARLELMTRPDIKGRSLAGGFGYVHIAFRLGSEERVNELTLELEHDGYTVSSRPRTTGDGYYESCILDPEGNQVELVA